MSFLFSRKMESFLRKVTTSTSSSLSSRSRTLTSRPTMFLLRIFSSVLMSVARFSSRYRDTGQKEKKREKRPFQTSTISHQHCHCLVNRMMANTMNNLLCNFLFTEQASYKYFHYKHQYWVFNSAITHYTGNHKGAFHSYTEVTWCNIDQAVLPRSSCSCLVTRLWYFLKVLSWSLLREPFSGAASRAQPR